MKKAVAYARFSSDNQREESIEAQFYEIKKYAQEEGIAILDFYYDEAISGLSSNRPGFLQMIEDVTTKGGIDYVIVHKVDRFSRDKYQSAIYKEKLSRRGIKVLYAAQRLSDTPEGGLMESILEGFAQYYSDNLSQETKKGLYTNARKAQYNGGFVPFGFDIDENKNYIINDHEAIAVRLMFDLYLKGQTYTSIARDINKLGYKTRLNKKFSDYSIKNILNNPKYCGTYTYGKRSFSYGESGKRTKKAFRDDNSIILIEDAFPAIVSKENFERVQKMIKERSNQRAYKQKIDYALRDLIFCSCGQKMYGYTNNKHPNQSYYRCSKCGNRIRRQDIEKYIFEVAKNYILANEEKLLKLIIDQVQKDLSSKDGDLKALKKRLDEIDQEEANCIDFITQMGASQKIKDKLDDLEKEKIEIEKLLKISHEPLDIEADVKNWLQKIRKGTEDTKLSKKELFQIMVKKIVVYDEEVKIFFNFPRDCLSSGITPAHAGTTSL